MADRTLAQIVTELDTAQKARSAAKAALTAAKADGFKREKAALKAANDAVTKLAREVVNYGKAPRKAREPKAPKAPK